MIIAIVHWGFDPGA